MRLTRTTSEPSLTVSDTSALNEAKEHLRIIHTDDDARIMRDLTTALQTIESETHHATIQATWRLYFADFPVGRCPIKLPRGPVYNTAGPAQLDAVIYYDSPTGLLALSGFDNPSNPDIKLVEAADPPALQPYDDTADWPEMSTDDGAEGYAQWKAGYADWDSLPQLLRTCALCLTEHYFYDRGDTEGQFPDQITRLLQRLDMRSDFEEFIA